MTSAPRSTPFLASALAAVAFLAPARAQTLHTTLVASGLTRPTYACPAPGDENRLFVTEQWTGNIRIVKNGVLQAASFVNVGPIATGNEQGLLGLAFHPQYATNGKFYVDLDNSGGTTIIREYTVSATNPDLADPASARQILAIGQPFSNHNGGNIQFGPDGYLYIGMGDGGSANDPNGNAQNINVLLGKMLRIDVDGDDFPTDATRNYAIPPTNPFAGAVAGADEIWHFGLRNPWRWSFDRVTGEMLIGDVGQGAWEEIDFAPAGVGGLNFGWRCMEGNNCTGLTGCTCFTAALQPAIQQYSHSFGCSITGGYVYRGTNIPALQGTYFYADYCSNTIWSFVYTPGNPIANFTDRTAQLDPAGASTITSIVSFGEDARGELLIVEQGGEIWRIDGPAPGIAACSGDGTTPTPCPCANVGGAGRGCGNSVSATGGLLSAEGVTSPDSIRFTASSLPATAAVIFIAGDAIDPNGIVFGDGVLCASGTLRRLHTGAAVGGTAYDPGLFDGPLAAQSHVVEGSGTTLWYQTYYRNEAAFCTPAAFNATNAYVLTW